MDASRPAHVDRSHIEAVPDRYYLVLAPEISAAEYKSLLVQLKNLGLVPARKDPNAGEEGADDAAGAGNIKKHAETAAKSKGDGESDPHQETVPETIPASPPRALVLESHGPIVLDEARERLKDAGVRYLNPVYRLKATTSPARRTYAGQIIIQVPRSDLSNLTETLEAVAPGAAVKELADLLPPYADHRLLTLLDDLAIFKVIELPAMVDALDVAEALNQRLRVSTAAPDWIHMDVRVAANGEKEPFKGGGWHLDATNVRELWKVVQGEQLPIVAVIDGGFDFDHPSLEGRLRPDTTFFSLSNQPPAADTFGDANTPVMHGTQVASILTGDDATASPPFVPIAPGVNVIGIVVGYYEGGGITYQESEIALGIYRAIASNASIINISLELESSDLLSYFLLFHAEERGVLVVASTGNYSVNSPDESAIAYPASHPTVLAVGGHDNNDFWARWSGGVRAARWSGGHGVDLAGPAVEIRTLPENMETSGTSFAAPIVAGIAALLLAEFPFATPYHLRQALMKGADDPHKDELHPERLGHGCVNAMNAHHELTLIAPTKPGETPMIQFRTIDWLSFITGLTLGLVLGGSAIGAWKKGDTPGDPIHPVPTIHGDVMQLSGSTCINPGSISTDLTINLFGPSNAATPVATDTVSNTNDHYEFEYVDPGKVYKISINGASGNANAGCSYEATVKATNGTVTKHLYNP